MASQAPPTMYMPIIPPPTPAPSPPPGQTSFHGIDPIILAHLASFATLSPAARRLHLHALIQACTSPELLFLSTTIAPLLRRDFLHALPTEVSLHILSFIHDPRSLARAARVSRYWNELLKDECLWKEMCIRHGFSHDLEAAESYRLEHESDARSEADAYDSGRSSVPTRAESDNFPYRKFFIYEYLRSVSF